MKNYKKLILTLMVLVFGIGAANAQLRFGVKAGVNINNLHLNNTSAMLEDNNRCGYTVGLMTEFQVPVIGLCFDLSAMYTRMNSEVEGTPGYENVAYNKNFLEVPVNIKYKFGLPVIGNFFTPYLFTGPSFAIKLDKNPIDAYKTKTCQTAWNVGLGFQIVQHLQLQAGYGFGINNVAKFAGINGENIKIKNNYWTVSAAYLF